MVFRYFPILTLVFFVSNIQECFKHLFFLRGERNIMMKKSLLLSAVGVVAMFGAMSMTRNAEASFEINANWKPAMYESVAINGGSNFSDDFTISGAAFKKAYTGMNAEGLYLFGDTKSSSKFGVGVVLGYQKIEGNADTAKDSTSIDKPSKNLTPLVLYSQSEDITVAAVAGGVSTDLRDSVDFTKVTLTEASDTVQMGPYDISKITGVGDVSLGSSFKEKSAMQIGLKLAYEYDMGNIVLGAGVSGSMIPTTLKWSNVIDTVTNDGTADTHKVSEDTENSTEFTAMGYGLDATVGYKMGMVALKLGIALDGTLSSDLTGSDTPVPAIDDGKNLGVGKSASDKFTIAGDMSVSLLAGVSFSF